MGYTWSNRKPLENVNEEKDVFQIFMINLLGDMFVTVYM